MRHSFHVDLRGIVDLLSHHLYTSPRVFVRELLQNGTDAITARRELDPAAPARIAFEPAETTGDGTLRVHDTGIGLTESQVHEFLATIGGSSKRDELGFVRTGFLGQFGIGLLSCFLVAEEIEVTTRSAAADSPTVVWRGHGDGHYTVATTDEDREPGTTVLLRPRPGAGHWVRTDTVAELARHYGSMLSADVRVAGEPVTGGGPPWLGGFRSPALRREALLDYGERLLGTRPLDMIDLDVAAAGVTGVAFVLPTEVHPGQRAAHRVYLKRMLLGDRVERVLPEWAFFVRCVLDTTELRPTASREQLFEDELLTETREALGRQIRDWLVHLSTTAPRRLQVLLDTHRRSVLAMALHDAEMRALVAAWVPLQTNAGWVTFDELRRQRTAIRYTTSDTEFQELGGVAAAQGVGVVNGGLEYVADLLQRIGSGDRELDLRPLRPAELADAFDPVDAAIEPLAAAFLRAAAPPLRRLGCEPAVRAFQPPSVPALYLDSIEHWARDDAIAAHREAEGAWGQVLGAAPEEPAPLPTLVFNARNRLTQQLMSLDDPSLVELGVEALHGQALLTGHRALRSADLTALQRALLRLVERAIDG